jgi:hypothetical protein
MKSVGYPIDDFFVHFARLKLNFHFEYSLTSVSNRQPYRRIERNIKINIKNTESPAGRCYFMLSRQYGNNVIHLFDNYVMNITLAWQPLLCSLQTDLRFAALKFAGGIE